MLIPDISISLHTESPNSAILDINLWLYTLYIFLQDCYVLFMTISVFSNTNTFNFM